MSEVQPYDAIVFDFGNIFLRLNYEIFFAGFSQLMGRPFNRETVPSDLIQAMRQHEKGLLSNEDWVAAFQVHNPNLTKAEIFNAWNKLLVGVPAHHFSFLESLGKKYRLFLLSNINAVHEAWIDKYMKNTYDIDDFKVNYFEDFFYSHYIHLRKPDDDIYEFVEDKLKSKGVKKFIFIDDMEENVLAARAMGWNAEQHNPEEDITEKLELYLNKRQK